MLTGVGLDNRQGLRFEELGGIAARAEQLGFDSIWTPSGTVPDAFHVCAAWSQATTALRTGISVVPVARLWNPLSLASQAATLAQLSGGRFVLGLGAGGSGDRFWESVGLPNRPIAYMRDYVAVLRGLVSGGTVSVNMPGLRLEGAALSGTGVIPPVPIYLAALGPQMHHLAGQIADGVLLSWSSPERNRVNREILDEASEQAGRSRGEVRLAMYVRVCIDEDVDAARMALGRELLGYALGRPGSSTGAYRSLFGELGFESVLTELEARRARGDSLDDLVRASPDELFESVAYFGPAPAAAAAFTRLTRGVDEAIIRIVPTRPGPDSALRTMTVLQPAPAASRAHLAGK